MAEKLQLLILDDKRAGDWLRLLKKDYPGLEALVRSRLQNAVDDLQQKSRELHIVLADFRLDDADGSVSGLKGSKVVFENVTTAAMGANLTLFAEGLRNERGSKCTILVNKLYTVEKEYLKTYSLESHLLNEYYFKDNILHNFSVESLTLNDMKILLDQSLKIIQKRFIEEAADAGTFQRQLHHVLGNRVVKTFRRHSFENDEEFIKSIFNGALAPSRDALKQELNGLLDLRLGITNAETGAEIILPVSALFPLLYQEYDRFCKYGPKLWGDLRDFESLVSELVNALSHCRNKSQEFGMFLDRTGLLDLIHTDPTKACDESGHLRKEILEQSQQPPFNCVFGLEEVLLRFNANHEQFHRNNLGYSKFFKYGDYDGIPNTDRFDQTNLAARFLGFRLDEGIVDELIKVLGPRYQASGITINPGESSFDATGEDGRGLGASIYTDKNRLLKAVDSVLDESSKHAYPSQFDREKTVDISFRYDKKSHCGKLIVDDNGQGMSRKTLCTIPRGKWADIISSMEGWVEDIWIITNDGSGFHQRSLLKNRKDRVNEEKGRPGTKVVFLFALNSETPRKSH